MAEFEEKLALGKRKGAGRPRAVPEQSGAALLHKRRAGSMSGQFVPHRKLAKDLQGISELLSYTTSELKGL